MSVCVYVHMYIYIGMWVCVCVCVCVHRIAGQTGQLKLKMVISYTINNSV